MKMTQPWCVNLDFQLFRVLGLDKKHGYGEFTWYSTIDSGHFETTLTCEIGLLYRVAESSKPQSTI